MNAYYVQKDGNIFPIYGVNSIEEAKEFVIDEDQGFIVETDEDVYIDPETGAAAFESGWDDLSKVVEAKFSLEEERWIEA